MLLCKHLFLEVDANWRKKKKNNSHFQEVFKLVNFKSVKTSGLNLPRALSGAFGIASGYYYFRRSDQTY